MIVKVCVEPLSSASTVQTPPAYVPAVVVGVPTRVKPVGSASATTTPVALVGPALLTLTVKVTDVPTFGLVVLALLVTEISARCSAKL